jgi:chemotaxis protein MotB
MARRKKAADKEMETGGMMRWLLTYADMITLLLAMFILLYAISKVNLEKYQKAMNAGQEAFNKKVIQKVIEEEKSPINDPYNDLEVSLQEAYKVIQRILEQENLADKIQLIIEERGLRISFMTDGVFFDLGKADLKPDFVTVLKGMAPTFDKITNNIRIEGHTCDIPIDTIEFPSNWELSTRRATNVLRYLIDAGISGDRMAAAGYADTRPVVLNDSEEHRTRNRRVDIVILRTVESQLEPKSETKSKSGGAGHEGKEAAPVPAQAGVSAEISAPSGPAVAETTPAGEPQPVSAPSAPPQPLAAPAAEAQPAVAGN